MLMARFLHERRVGRSARAGKDREDWFLGEGELELQRVRGEVGVGSEGGSRGWKAQHVVLVIPRRWRNCSRNAEVQVRRSGDPKGLPISSGPSLAPALQAHL